jgi:NADH:ubiquinone oxidoreductase subunit E
MLRGADEVWEHLCDHEGVSQHGGTTEDGRVTIQEAQCLGYCDRAPCLQVDADETLGPLTPDGAAQLVDDLRAAPAPEEFWR